MRRIREKVASAFGKIKDKKDKIKKSKQIEYENIEQLDKKLKEQEKKSEKLRKQLEKRNDIGYMFSFWIIGVLIVYVAYLLFSTINLIYLIIAAFIFSMAMEAIIEIFNKKLPRLLSIIISYIIGLLFIVFGFLIIVPFFIAQTADIIGILVDNFNNIQKTLKQDGLAVVIKESAFIPGFLKEFLINFLQEQENINISSVQSAIQQNIAQIVDFGNTMLKNVGGFAVSIISGFFSAIFQILVVFILAIFFSIQKDGVINFIGSLSNQKDYVILKVDKLYKKLGFWLKGQLLLSLFIFITVFLILNTIALFGIDLPNKFSLALIAGLTEFVPIAGPIIGAIPAVVVAIAGYGMVGFVVVVLSYLIIQAFENYVLIPLVMNHALGISPLVIVIAMFMGGSLMGIMGIILSVPVAVIINLIFEDILKK